MPRRSGRVDDASKPGRSHAGGPEPTRQSRRRADGRTRRTPSRMPRPPDGAEVVGRYLGTRLRRIAPGVRRERTSRHGRLTENRTPRLEEPPKRRGLRRGRGGQGINPPSDNRTPRAWGQKPWRRLRVATHGRRSLRRAGARLCVLPSRGGPLPRPSPTEAPVPALVSCRRYGGGRPVPRRKSRTTPIYFAPERAGRTQAKKIRLSTCTAHTRKVTGKGDPIRRELVRLARTPRRTFSLSLRDEPGAHARIGEEGGIGHGTGSDARGVVAEGFETSSTPGTDERSGRGPASKRGRSWGAAGSDSCGASVIHER